MTKSIRVDGDKNVLGGDFDTWEAFETFADSQGMEITWEYGDDHSGWWVHAHTRDF